MLSLWKAYIHEKKAGNTIEWQREFFDLIKSTGYNELVNKNFLGWPGDVVNDKYYGEKSWTLSDCLSPELRISEKDAHPNEMGQQKLAEEFLKRLHENKILQER